MKLFALLLSAILAATVVLVFAYRSNGPGSSRDALRTLMRKFDRTEATHGTPAPAPLPKAPEAHLAEAVTIKTPEGELTIPQGTRVRVMEKAKPGMVAINYQGYTAPIPETAIDR